MLKHNYITCLIKTEYSKRDLIVQIKIIDINIQ